MRLKNLLNLTGRRALITGGAGMLGGVIASTLGEMGADLILVDSDDRSFTSLSQDLANHFGIKVDCFRCDLERQNERSELIAKLILEYQNLNILINNAAFIGSSKLDGWSVPFEDQTCDTWRRAIEVNLIAAFDLCQGLSPLLQNSVGANIINVASIYGQNAPDWSLYEGTNMSNPAAYGASKAGLIQLTRWLASTLAPKIRVNSISPGGIYRNQPDIFVDRYANKTPLGRMALEEDFCGTFAFLASDMAEYITGQNIFVDGGWGIR